MNLKYCKSIAAFCALFFVLIFSATITSAAAKKFYSGDLYYEITKEASGKTTGTVTLIGMKENSNIKTLIVPETVANEKKTYMVTSISGTAQKTYSGSFDGGTTAFDTVEEVSLPSTLKTIGVCAFKSNKVLKEIVIPDQVTTIDYMAFCGCRNLEKVTLPKSLKTIKSFAFYRCISLNSLKLPTSVTSIGISALSKTGLKSITLSKNTALGAGVFSDCKHLKKVVIPADSKIKKLGPGTFKGCLSLTDITFPKNMTTILEHCFLRCSSLSNITLPSKVTAIGADAFKECPSLKKITFTGTQKITFSDDALDSGSAINLILPKGASALQTALEKHFASMDQTPAIEWK